MLRQYKLKDYKFRLVLWVLILSVIGIMVIGNYDRDHLNRDQLLGIEKIVKHLAKKYGIDISKTHDGVIKCDMAVCKPFRMVHTASLLTHGDVGTTSCPGHDISEKIP